MADMNVTLSRHRWNAKSFGGAGAYVQPDGSLASLDLRNLEQQATPGVETDNSLLCLMAPDANLDDSHIVIASGEPRDVRVDSKIIAPLLSALKVPALAGDTLADCIADLLLTNADPKGLDRCKPLMPTVQRQLEMWLGGKAFAREFTYGVDTHSNHVQSVIQDDVRAVFEAIQAGKIADPDLAAKQVDYLTDKLGISKSDKAVWDKLIPADLRDEIAVLVPHSTTQGDDFNRADEDSNANWPAFGSSPQIWVRSNQCWLVGGYGIFNFQSAVSSSDNEANVKRIANTGSNYQAAGCRRNNNGASTTGYLVWDSDGTREVYAFSGTTGTNLYSSGTWSNNDVMLVGANGSTIYAKQNGGAAFYSGTDTTYSSGLYGGLMSFKSGVPDNSLRLDDYQIADLAAGGPTVPIFDHHYRMLRMQH